MNSTPLRDDIVSFLRARAQGRDNAIPRHRLLENLHSLGHTLTDRTLRRVYASIPQVGYSVEGNHRGLFWITSLQERREVEGNQHSKAMATLKREKAIREAGDGGQMELWGQQSEP